VLTSTGKYFWIPVHRIESLDFDAPTRPRDLLWRPCRMSVGGGPDGTVFLPTLYPGTCEVPEPHLRLGRATEWSDEPDAPVRGCGLRTFLVGDNALTILELQSMHFARTDAEAA
jgi:type VI secretion system protein ImpE